MLCIDAIGNLQQNDNNVMLGGTQEQSVQELLVLNDSLRKGTPRATKQTKKSSRHWKKPKGMPKRPLSAYNLFFAQERQRIIQINRMQKSQHAAMPGTPKIVFGNLARTVATKWKGLTDLEKEPFTAVAAEEQSRYKTAMKKWRYEQRQNEKKQAEVTSESNGTSSATDTKQPYVVQSVFSHQPAEKHIVEIVDEQRSNIQRSSTIAASTQTAQYFPIEAARFVANTHKRENPQTSKFGQVQLPTFENHEQPLPWQANLEPLPIYEGHQSGSWPSLQDRDWSSILLQNLLDQQEMETFHSVAHSDL